MKKDEINSALFLPILGGLFVLVVAGGLGAIFSAVGNEATIGIGLGIVLLAPIAGSLILGGKGALEDEEKH